MGPARPLRTQSDTFVRVGTSGGMQPGTKTGDVAIVTGAIRDEGTSRQYLPLEFPAVADPDVVFAMRSAAGALEIPHRCGVTHSKVIAHQIFVLLLSQDLPFTN